MLGHSKPFRARRSLLNERSARMLDPNWATTASCTAMCPPRLVARSPWASSRARRAFAQGVIRQLVGAWQVSRRYGRGSGDQVSPGVVQHSPGKPVVRRDLTKLSCADQLPDAAASCLPAQLPGMSLGPRAADLAQEHGGLARQGALPSPADAPILAV
jgi:hypothetical protein